MALQVAAEWLAQPECCPASHRTGDAAFATVQERALGPCKFLHVKTNYIGGFRVLLPYPTWHTPACYAHLPCWVRCKHTVDMEGHRKQVAAPGEIENGGSPALGHKANLAAGGCQLKLAGLGINLGG